MKQFSLFLLSFLLLIVTFGQIPANYYKDAEGKKQLELKIALSEIISKDYVQRTYSQLWTDFYTTDARADGKVWDMYSNCIFTFGTDQDNGTLGNTECDWYNREHSVPNSWFGGQVYPMYSDLFHLYPTDKYVNAQRGNYPYGETNATNSYGNGSKRGAGTPEFGYTGIVFEPIDEYKGDFARTYLYMTTRYIDRNLTEDFGSITFTYNNTTSDLTDYAINLLLKWHRDDPVSEKELNRNNAVYVIQNNRNPFIYYPELAEHIWGNLIDVVWNPSVSILENKMPITIKIIKDNHGIYIDGAAPHAKIDLFNIFGQNIYNDYMDHNFISLSHLQRGIYIVRIDEYVEKIVW
jgi:endonuclease I